jgi:hypothetical protein
VPDENPNVFQPNQPAAPSPVEPAPTPPMPPRYPAEPPRQPFMPGTEPAPRSRKRLWLFIIALVIVLGLAAGYVFAFYLPAQPSNMYKSGLTNTGKALDALITYSAKHKADNYKSASFTGSAQVKSAEGSFDFDTSGSVDNKGNGSATLKADVMGQKFQGNLRTVIPKKSTTPDIYFQVSNAEKLLSQYGLQKYSEKWIVIDHTMLDTLAKSAENEKDKTTPEVTAPTYDQVRDAIDKVQTLNKQYLFTTDPQYAVLKDQQFIAKEQIHDRTHYHYKVAYNKDHLKTYVAEVKKALDSSKLNEWSEKVNHKKLSEQIKFDDQIKEIDKAKSDYKFDLWVDAKTRVVSQLQFTEVKDSSAKITFGQNYTGGDQYPFSLSFNSKDDNGHPESGTLNMTIDTKTNKVSFDLTGKIQDATGKSADFSGDFSITPSTKGVKVDAPKDATPINNVIGELFGGALAGSGSQYTDKALPAPTSSFIM